MKTVLITRKNQYRKRISFVLIALALVAAMVNCDGGPALTYDLIMAVNPAEAGTATDETDASPYPRATVVDIKAEPADCYQFVNWTTSAGTLGNASALETTITMPAEDVTVTANFEPKPADHFKFYHVDFETTSHVETMVQLVDQFGAFNATITYAFSFGNPVEKIHNDLPTPISDTNRHFTLYELELEGDRQSWKVTVNNQFQDDVELTVIGPSALAVPTQKDDHEVPVCLNHYLIYDAYGPLVNDEVMLNDQFTEEQVVVYEPYYFANPVQKTLFGEVTEIEDQDPHDHLVWYTIEGEAFEKRVEIDNQFGPQTIDLVGPGFLAVPSQKISWEQPLDHFKVYTALGTPVVEQVQLMDQFGTINASVGAPVAFANPTNKEYGDEKIWRSNPANHLTLYALSYQGTYPNWWVRVENQFGINQQLWLSGPHYLAVPTQKWPHGPTKDLDHFLVYNVIDSGNEPQGVIVDLYDQFCGFFPWMDVNVYEPTQFATPVQKTHGNTITLIKNDDEHLVFYKIDGGAMLIEGLSITNQFGEDVLDVSQTEFGGLAVPSLKVQWGPAL